jgi:hypothetical protein
MTPAGTPGTNEEIAGTILFLCSNGAPFLHGRTIEVNGGLYRRTFQGVSRCLKRFPGNQVYKYLKSRRIWYPSSVDNR